MTTLESVSPRRAAARARPRAVPFLARAARGRVLARLAAITWGEIVIADAFGTHRFGSPSPAAHDPAPAVRIEVRDPRFWLETALGGSVGAGEAWVARRWECNDLVGLVRILVRNRGVLEGLERGLARLRAPALKLWHLLRDNSRAGSQRNIGAHYDIGNDFYAAFLDETMMYSCALFERGDEDLRTASEAKLERVCAKLALGPGDHLLEIGTGWGGFAVHAAGRHGCRVTTTTISREQHRFATERVRAAGLADRVTVLLSDYRDLEGSYDKIVSLEMIEAVGERHFDDYFARTSRLLEPHGMMLLQAITMQDQLYEPALRSVDFIQRHVFPGCCLPSVAAIADRVARVTDMRIWHLEDITPHYATTLRLWRERMLASERELCALGHSDERLRLFEFYFAYCEGGFLERSIGDVQVLLTKPLCRRPSILPPLG